MLIKLMILLTIRGICCLEKCPDFEKFNNDANLITELDGVFYVAYTSANILSCERCTWTAGPNNARSAYVESKTGCCMQIDNFVSTNAGHYQYTIKPVRAGCGLTTSIEVGNIKLLAKTVSDNGVCLIISICRSSRNGLLVMCRQKLQQSIWLTIIGVLMNLVNSLLTPIPFLDTVNQSACVFGNTCTV